MRPTDLLKGFLSALGLTGALVVTGFIIESGYQQLLGTMTGFLGTTAYIASASDFLLDTSLLLTHASGWAMAQILLLVAGVLLAGWAIRKHQAPVQKAIRPSRRPLMLIVSAAAVVNLTWFVLPVATVENVLAGHLADVAGDSPEKPHSRLGFAAGDVLLSTVCGHMPATNPSDTKSSKYKALVEKCKASAPGEYKDSKPFQDYYVEKFKNGLVQNGLNVCWLVALAAMVFAASGYFGIHAMDLEAMLAVCLLSINLIGIPFQYGKTVRLKPVPDASVWLAPDLLPALSLYKTGLLIYETDSGCTLVDGTTGIVWFVPKEKVAAIQTHDAKDVLAFYIEETIAKVDDQ